jgi:Cd2+/Zn2+-exporting ATPase
MSLRTLHVPVTVGSENDCRRCVTRLEEEALRLNGVLEASVSPDRSLLHVTFDPDQATLSGIEEQARRIGARIASETEHETIELRNLDCPDCAASIEKAVNRVPGVYWAGANFAAARMHVEFDPTSASLDRICKVVEAHGVGACPVRPASGAPESEGSPEPWLDRHRRAVVTAASVALTLAGAVLRPLSPTAATALLALTIVVGGWAIARSGWLALRARALDMNVLMTLAVAGAAAVGEWLEGAMVVALYSLGNLLQAGAMERTRQSIRRLVQLSPATARVRRDGRDTDIPVSEVRPGDLLFVRPGERVPADGEVFAGRSAVNQAPITGESLPVEKQAGDAVFAGTLNGSGALEVRATRAYRDTTLARIIHRVEEAQAQRAPTQQLIDRFARIYTPIVVALALAVAVVPPLVSGAWAEWFLRGLSLLIIACPCALVVSTPVAIVTALGAASRMGALVKGGAYLEELGRVRALLFDKTGTLTTGAFSVVEVVPIAEWAAGEALAVAAAIEARSEHPLAAAFLAEARARGLAVPDVEAFEAVPGMGARGRVAGRSWSVGNRSMMAAAGVPLEDADAALATLERAGRTAVVLAEEHRPVAVIALADTPRQGVAEVVRALRRLGVDRQAMVTGDHLASARAVSEQAGLDETHAALLPEQKLELVREYRELYSVVGMVGDGINDAPALAAASVGIAMGAAGNDTAIETADIALLGGDLSRLPALVALSRQTQAVIRQNIAFSLITKAALILAALTAGLPLWLAVFGDVGVSLIVTGNALRLRAHRT